MDKWDSIPHQSNNYLTVLIPDKLKNLPQAEAHYRPALNADAQSAEAAQSLGLTLAKTENLIQAERYLLQAVHLRPAFSSGWNNLGLLYLQHWKMALRRILPIKETWMG